MSTKGKVFLAIGIWLGLAILALIVFGSAGKNEAFQPQDEFKLEPWVEINIAGIDFSITKAVLYLFLASALTIWVMTYIANRMKQKPNAVQMGMELAYDLTSKNIVGENMGRKMAKKWFPFIAALFFWIWFSNMIGLIPLPVNTAETVNVFGIDFPAFALYAATANLSIPLVLTIVVFVAYNVEGMREHGPIRYFGTWLPGGLEDMNPAGKTAIFMIEVVSNFVRLISLSVRLFANVLAGHLLILFMAGGLAVLLGVVALGILTFPLGFAFYVFEVVLVATLQAFIFAILTAIYLGSATAESH